MASGGLVDISRQDEVAIVRMNFEKKLNAMNFPMIKELSEAFIYLDADESVRAIVYTGTGRSFIVGADIDVMKDLDPQGAVNFISALHGLMRVIRELGKPVIAGINGFCFGGGLEVAISCDFLVASEKAIFGMQEVKVGIPSVIEAALFPVCNRPEQDTGNIVYRRDFWRGPSRKIWLGQLCS